MTGYDVWHYRSIIKAFLVAVFAIVVIELGTYFASKIDCIFLPELPGKDRQMSVVRKNSRKREYLKLYIRT